MTLMKQLPLIASTLYCTPWHVDSQTHAELGKLYRSYITGNLPEQLEGSKQVSSGVAYQVDSRSGIAIIYVQGIIGKRVPDMLCGPQIADLAKIDVLLKDLATDDNIRTLIIWLDTPGGVGIGLQETSENIRDVIESGTRVVAYTDYLCASAGYWIAAACQEIYAAPSAKIGSIGTYIAAIDDSRAWEMEGLELKLFRDGDLKAMGHPGKAWTEEEEKFLTEMLEQHSAEFKDHVRAQRPGIEDGTMRGQAFSASRAPAGLVDGIFRDLESLIASEMEILDADVGF